MIELQYTLVIVIYTHGTNCGKDNVYKQNVLLNILIKVNVNP
jgi:hypothetical protein